MFLCLHSYLLHSQSFYRWKISKFPYFKTHTQAYMPNVGKIIHIPFVKPTNKQTSNNDLPTYRLLYMYDSRYIIVPYMTCQYIANPIHPTYKYDDEYDDIIIQSGLSIAAFTNNDGGMVDKPLPKSIKKPNDSRLE